MAGPTPNADAASPGDDTPVTLADAVATIERATAFTEPLRRRAEGVTMALWGLVTACIVLSNGLLDDVYGYYHAGGWRFLVSSFLWVPWAAIGVAGTLAVWRIAEASAGRRAPGRRRSPVAIVAWFAVLAGLVFVIAVFPAGGAGAAVAFIGLVWLAIGGLDVYNATPIGRRTLIAVGAIVVVAGAAYAWVSSGWPVEDAWRHFEAVAVLAAGLVPVLGGLAQTFRG